MHAFSRRRRFWFEHLEPRQLLAADLVISEFQASNQFSLVDGNGNSSDWIEIENRGDAPISLEGWSLTDDRSQLAKWKFPKVELISGGILVVFASGDNRPDIRGNLHTSFRLGAEGEYLALVSPDLQIQHEYAPSFPPQATDHSYGLAAVPSARTAGYFDLPTPGKANGPLFRGITAITVTSSHGDRTFTDAFEVTLSSSSPGTIHYTLDGTDPNTSSPVYSGPLPISKTTTLQARVIEPEHVAGPLASYRYIKLANSVASARSHLPLLVIDNYGAGAIPNSGWNQTNTGIRQVARQTAKMLITEPVAGSATLLGDSTSSTPIGIRVRGAFSSTFAEPGYSIETWQSGRETAVDVSLLGMEPASDWVLSAPNPSYDEAMIDNTLMYELDRELGHWSPDYRYVELYLNRDGGDITTADYEGLYVLVEKVERGKGRIEFDSFADDGTDGGWLLAINRLDPIGLDGSMPKNFHTAGADGILKTARDLHNSSGVGDDIPTQSNAYINFEHPSPQDITEPQRASIEGWFRKMETVLFGREPGVTWNDPVNGYSKYIDVDSFIDYLILSNLSKNGDALLLSLWIYNPDPNGDGKLTMGPMWDVDLGSFSGEPAAELMRNQTHLWYGRMFRDPEFTQRYTDRWNELRQGPLTNSNMKAIIERLEAKIGTDVARRDNVADWPARIDRMISWVSQRADAMDRSLILPPQFTPPGGTVVIGTRLQVTTTAGDLYVTLDGSDPRSPGGAISPKAIRVTPTSDPILLDLSTTKLAARALRGTRWSPLSIATYEVVPRSALFDLDRDGLATARDVDLFNAKLRSQDPTADWNQDQRVDVTDLRAFLSEGWGSTVGDANLDGHFNSTDLVQIFSAGRYEATDGVLATWETGDWDGDGRFTSSDLVMAWSIFGYQGG